MRDIKFRAWDKDQKRFGYIDLSSSDFGDPSWFDYPLQQYTGLNDKNGKEIWEGDIVQANYYAFTEGKDYKIKGEVIYDTEQFIGYKIGDTRMSAATSFEVIGNIYQNPELIK